MRESFIAATLSSLLIALYPAASRCQTFQTNVIAQAESPDETYVAAIVTMSYNGQVMAGPSLSIRKAGSNETVMVFELSDAPDARLLWVGNSKILVCIPVGSKINWHGVSAGYPRVYVTGLDNGQCAP